MAVSIEQVSTAVAQIEHAVDGLAANFEAPESVVISGKPFFRHRNKSDLLLSYLKCVRSASTLNAALVLLQQGFVQEIGALCRCVDDFNQDVMFLATPLGENGPSEQQSRLVAEFFQEEFDNLEDPMRSSQVRNRVPRSKVLAGIARIPGQPMNPNDAQEVQRTLQQAFSGYVHGAYVHIMEMFGGSAGALHFHLHGLSGTPRIAEWTEALASYVYRTMVAVELVAKRTGNVGVGLQIQVARVALEGQMGPGNTNGGDNPAPGAARCLKR